MTVVVRAEQRPVVQDRRAVMGALLGAGLTLGLTAPAQAIEIPFQKSIGERKSL